MEPFWVTFSPQKFLMNETSARLVSSQGEAEKIWGNMDGMNYLAQVRGYSSSIDHCRYVYLYIDSGIAAYGAFNLTQIDEIPWSTNNGNASWNDHKGRHILFRRTEKGALVQDSTLDAVIDLAGDAYLWRKGDGLFRTLFHAASRHDRDFIEQWKTTLPKSQREYVDRLDN